MHTIVQDLRYGLRLLIKSPIFTIAAVLSLAIGIGASTSIFSSARQQILRPISPAIKDPDDLARILSSFQGKYFGHLFSYSDYIYYKNENPVFSDILAYDGIGRKFALQSGKDADYISGAYVSGNFFSLLGIQPVLGRNLAPEDDSVENGKPVAVISYKLWKKLFKLNPSAIGTEIRLNRTPLVLIGVAPEQFTPIDSQFSKLPDIYLPLALQAQLEPKTNSLKDRNSPWLELIGRLKLGATLAQGQSVMQARASQLHYDYPGARLNRNIFVYPANRLSPELRRTIAGFMGMMTSMLCLIMLIPCANVASLLLARALDRRKEIAIRSALGAARPRIVRQLLTEALLIGLLAGAAGPVLAGWIIKILAGRHPENDLLFGTELNLDMELLCFTVILSIITSLIFGLVPALHMMRINLTSAMRDQGNERFRRFRILGAKNLLVVANIASALVVLVISGLFLDEMKLKTRVDPGFKPDNLLIVPLHMNPNDYSQIRAREFNLELLEHLNNQPGIRSAGLASSKYFNQPVSVPGYESRPGEYNFLDFEWIGPGYFRSVGIHILRGRDFSESEFQSGGDGIIINETMVRHYWQQQEALGRQVQCMLPEQLNTGINIMRTRTFNVVGVVRDSILARDGSLAESPPKPVAYLPLTDMNSDEMMLYVRTIDSAKAHAPTIRQIILAQDPALPITGMQTLSDQIEISMKPERYIWILLGILGLLALGLASMGLYAVVSYTVGRRSREISIRIAMGAHRGTVLRQMIFEGIQLTAIGLVIGLFMAWVIARWMESGGEGLNASHLFAYVAACLLLIPVAIGACYLPARRAVRANPMTALKID